MQIKQSIPFVGNEEYLAIKSCFDESWITEGVKSFQFSEEVKKIVGTEYSVLAPNGTLALYLALKSLGLEEGDEVIVPNHTFIATATSVVMANCVPVFVDCGKDLQMEVEQCYREGILSSRTKAIIPAHLYGSSVNMTKVIEFAAKYGLYVVEDAAQALGVEWNNQGCGSFGHAGCLSFFADKAITTAEGGAILTDSEEVFKQLSLLRNQGRYGGRGSFVHDTIGFNFRMTDIQCAIGLEQLKKKDFIFNKRRENYYLYLQHLENVEEVEVLLPSEGTTNFVPFRAVLMTKIGRQELSKFMKEKGIETRDLFYPLHKQPCFKYLGLDDHYFTNSISVYENGLCLPVHPKLTEKEIEYICNTIKEFYSE